MPQWAFLKPSLAQSLKPGMGQHQQFQGEAEQKLRSAGGDRDVSRPLLLEADVPGHVEGWQIVCREGVAGDSAQESGFRVPGSMWAMGKHHLFQVPVPP